MTRSQNVLSTWPKIPKTQQNGPNALFQCREEVAKQRSHPHVVIIPFTSLEQLFMPAPVQLVSTPAFRGIQEL